MNEQAQNNDEIIESFLGFLLRMDPMPQHRGIYFQKMLPLHWKIYEPILQKLLHDDIISEYSSTDNRVSLTHFGREIARKGYKSYLNELEIKQKDAIKSTIKENRKSWLDAIGSILGGIGTILGLLALFNTGDSTKIDKLNLKIDSLSKVVQQQQNQSKILVEANQNGFSHQGQKKNLKSDSSSSLK